MSDIGGVLETADRVLLVQLSAIGDVLRAGSVVASLRSRYPAARIGMLSFAEYTEVMQGIPGLSYIHAFPNAALRDGLNAQKSREDVLRALYDHSYLPLHDLQTRRYDVAVNFHFSRASALLTAHSTARRCFGMTAHPDGTCGVYGSEALALYDDLSSPYRDERSADHLARRYHRMCGLSPDGACLRFEVPDGTPDPMSHVPGGAGIAIHVGAGWRDKCWPSKHWRELIIRLGLELDRPVILLGTPAERDRNFRSVLAGLPGRRPEVVDLCGRPFLESARALSRCGIFIGADSGPMHLASALNVPVVALFGPTSAMESYPLIGRNAVVKSGRLADIPPQMVLEAVHGVMRPRPGRLPRWNELRHKSGLLLYENPSRQTFPRRSAA